MNSKNMPLKTPKEYRYQSPDEVVGKWEVQIKGTRCTGSFEITVIREDYRHGHRSWGWINENKLLISHNGGPCQWPLTPKVWDKMVALAYEVAEELNIEEEER